MDNTGTDKSISEEAPSFFSLHLVNGRQYLVPFICQQCGNCCRVAFDAPCQNLREPNMCLIYDRRPRECRTFPVSTGDILAQVVCLGYHLSQKAVAVLADGTNYCTGPGNLDTFQPVKSLDDTVTKLKRGDLPPEFIDRFIDLNS
ncbi:MAG: YkgJ family cysteine cluster protein [Dehalococcoidales bacterium]|nr:MAG: YkgJ family cysteine cluster protein [Dehalococcoidales bacterium]